MTMFLHIFCLFPQGLTTKLNFNTWKVAILNQLINRRTFLQLITLKGTAEALAVDHLGLSNPRGAKTAYFTPKRYEENLHPLHTEVLPLGQIPTFTTSHQCLTLANFTPSELYRK